MFNVETTDYQKVKEFFCFLVDCLKRRQKTSKRPDGTKEEKE